ncbi:hypothetical protein SNE26_07955 [Mucilaginibacter sp. cycad4]|uniref:hypothetical protein n=1 Tax=Mucilaginibacter sp. cycad4 TaxID=3342096 RepID=UPI002AAA8F01|nr:hypothetical protein [Mucilaginibacter gossypii]WPV01703.1 hypothetical protein SNE26_07955 [Mucilaginibacter gossypii]
MKQLNLTVLNSACSLIGIKPAKVSFFVNGANFRYQHIIMSANRSNINRYFQL